MENENKEIVKKQDAELCTDFDKSDFDLGVMPSFNQAMRMAKLFVASGQITSVRSMAEMATKIVIGGQLGIIPAIAIQCIFFVNGKPSCMTNAQLSKVQEKGFRWVELEGNRERCVLEWFDASGARLGQSSFDKEDAKLAGLAGSNTWQKYPADMLFNRAALRGIRKFCPAVFGGTIYDPDELRAAGMSERGISRINKDVEVEFHPEEAQTVPVVKEETAQEQEKPKPYSEQIAERVRRGRPRRVEAVQKTPYKIEGQDSIFYGRTIAELGGATELNDILENAELQEGLTADDISEIKFSLRALKN